MSLKKIEPIMKSHKNPSKLSSDFGELQTPNHCQKSKISQQNHPPKLHQFRPQHPTDDSTGPRCWFPMAKDPWWFSSLTIVVGLKPFYKKRWKKCHAVSVSPICRVFFCQNCGRTHPTFTKTHPLKMSHTQTKVCERHRHILWHAILSCCISISLFHGIHHIIII